MSVGRTPRYEDLREVEFLKAAGSIYLGNADVRALGPDSFPGNFNARKIWETVRVERELHYYDCLTRGNLGLGIGSGTEPLQFYLTHHGVRSLGTDLYGFGWPSAPVDMLWRSWDFAPYAYERELHRTLQMDGLKILMPDNSLDFVYSVSTVEHFGANDSLLCHLTEVRRSLKPGGWLVFSTELSLTGESVPGWCFSERDLETVLKSSGLIASSQTLPLDEALLKNPAVLRLPEWTIDPEDWGKLSVRHEGLIYTSVVLSLQKPATVSGELGSIPWPSAQPPDQG